jgi:hypothetical protein
MKLFTGSLLFASLFLISPNPAQALMIADIRDFSIGAEPFTNIAYGASQSSGFSWTHSLLEALGGLAWQDIELLAAELSVTYSRTNLTTELWHLEGLGNLAADFNPVTSVFQLGGSLFEDLKKDGILSVMVKELTTGADSFRIHTAVLNGHYESLKKAGMEVPEPSTLWLTAGALGFWGWKKRRAD